MERVESDIQVLSSLGFTNLEARVFIFLAQVERADIKKIASSTGIDRSNVSKTIARLIERGLVMKRIGMPNSYEVMPIEQTLTMLLKQNALEHERNQSQVNNLVKRLSQNGSKSSINVEEGEYFLIVPGKEPFYKKWDKAVKETKVSMDVIALEIREPQDSSTLDSYKPLFRRGVKARFLIDRSTHNDEAFRSRIRQMEELLKFPNLSVRYSFSSQRPYVAIRDGKIGLVTLDPTRFFKHSRTFWTNNPSLVIAFQEHFETMWNKATAI